MIPRDPVPLLISRGRPGYSASMNRMPATAMMHAPSIHEGRILVSVLVVIHHAPRAGIDR